MWRTKKFIVVAALLAVALVAGTTGVALAQDSKDGTGPRQALLTRVAQILGIDQQQLEDAVKQAMSEQREQIKEKGNQRLQDMVNEGKITQEQLDEFNAWLKAKPDINIHIFGLRNLDKLVEEGKITQQQADDLEAWLKARPELPLPNEGEFGGKRPGRGFGGSGFSRPPCLEGQESGSPTF